MSHPDTEALRFRASELNQVLVSLLADCKHVLGDLPDVQHLVTAQGKQVNYQKSERKVFFHSVKDADTASNRPELASIYHVLTTFLADPEHKHFNGKLFLPMVQCRGFMKLPYQLFGERVQRAHIVLVSVDIAAGRVLSIEAHDSSSRFAYTFYPDKLKRLADIFNCRLRYHTHAQQGIKDHYSCGWYLLAYLKALITGKSIVELKREAQAKVARSQTKENFITGSLLTTPAGKAHYQHQREADAAAREEEANRAEFHAAEEDFEEVVFS